MEKKKIIDSTVIEKFLNGHDEMERIIAIETDFMNPTVSVIYVDSEGNKRIRVEPFKPFVWAKIEVGQKLFGGDRKVLAKELRNHGMWVKQLDTTSVNGENERIENGYKFLFYAVKQMSYNDFINFFRKGGVPLYPKGNEPDTKEFLKVTPTEQFMIATGKRLFKGYNSYGELKRLIFDIETQGLNPSVHAIEQIGVRTNKGLERVISVFGHTEAERKASELNAIREFLKVIHDEKPDIIVGHNSENFDWNFIIERLIVLGSDIETESSVYFEHPIYKKKKETVLKLGGEVEYYFPTIIWGHNVLDSLHASRRAQATDSNMKSSNLKYVTQYLNLKKDNRVYVPGDKITKVWGDTNEHYSFNNTNGEWHEITESRPLGEGCEVVTGKYIVERYLLDDLWETDKIEEKLNETNFLIGKWLPTTFSRAATMGTAGIWKLIMLAWSYENDLAVPALSKNRKFTGGLSRLLEMGYKPRIVKLDFNSLYPATILTWNIKNSVDGSDVLNKFLEYVLTTREVYKGLKKQYGKKAEELRGQLSSFVGTAKERKLIEDEHLHYKAEESLADKKQSQVKVLANSYFGSAGSPGLFPWGDDMAAEMTTCLGRMQLRLMISHFKNLGYQPVVGDSVTYDTPIIVKYENNEIDIIPICEVFNNSEAIEFESNQYRDFSPKSYEVLTRDGWQKIEYVYKHKTDKQLKRVETKNGLIDCTEDHSLFDNNGNEVKPSSLKRGDKLEIYTNGIEHSLTTSISNEEAWNYGFSITEETRKIPSEILNASTKIKKSFIEGFCFGSGQNVKNTIKVSHNSKTVVAAINFILNELGYNHFTKEDEVWNCKDVTSKSEYVYDISANGTFVNALGMIVCHNTDGFNFQMPETFRYTDEHPYISNGKGRNSKEGKAYTKVEADVAEFEDIYFNHAYNGGINKSGLGIDEYCDACIQFGRKNYADLMPDGSIKKVGNTIKSRKMSGYLEKFIDNGVDLLLHNRGKDFIDSYYDYIEKIYNYQIPIKDIASKGSIKKTLKEYVDDCQKTTKTGAKKSRQAWYELALREGLNLNLGDTIYYINTGVKRSESDCKRITRYFTTDENGKKKNITSAIETLARASNPKKTKMEVGREIYGANFFEEDEIILNCKIVPQEIIEREDDVLCDEYEGLEYNIEKYIDQFNKRVKPLLVCFSKLVRDNILITNPKDRRYFTEKESELVSGIPNKEEDQDTYDVLMTPEPKEIEFWLKVNQVPPFVEECGIPWDILVEEYKEKKKLEDDALFKEEDAKYQKVIESLTKTEIDEFITDLTIPKQLAAIVHLCSDGRFYFNKLPEMTPSGGGYAIDDVPRGYAEYVE